MPPHNADIMQGVGGGEGGEGNGGVGRDGERRGGEG